MKLLIKAQSHASSRPRGGGKVMDCPRCKHPVTHHLKDKRKREGWVGPCRACGPFQSGRCEGAPIVIGFGEAFDHAVKKIEKAQPRDDKDRPEYGKVYSLGGPRSIAAGDTWQGSEVWCGGTRSDHSAYGCRAKADHEHVGPDHIRHMRGAAKINGCTPYRCGKKAEKAGPEGGCKEPGCPAPGLPHRDSPSWRASGPQVYHDGYRGTHRVLRFAGSCVGCGRRTYSFDDGQNDPRGVLGDHASSAEYAEDHDYPSGLKQVPACFNCMNDHARYDNVMRIAHRRWGKELEGQSRASMQRRDTEIPDKLPKDITDMDKSAAYDPFRARVRKLDVGVPALRPFAPAGTNIGIRRKVRTQGVNWDDARDEGKKNDPGDLSYEPKVTGKRTWQKAAPMEPVAPAKVAPWARERKGVATHYKKERTNPAAVAQIKDARANGMGQLGKGFGSEDCPVCGDEMYSPEEMAEHRAGHDACKVCGHERANHVQGFRYDGTRAHCTDCRHEKRQKMDDGDPSFQMIDPYHSIQTTKFGKARKPDQYPPPYPDGFVTEVHRDTRICKSCGMPSGDHLKGCKGGGTEKVSDQVVKKGFLGGPSANIMSGSMSSETHTRLVNHLSSRHSTSHHVLMTSRPDQLAEWHTSLHNEGGDESHEMKDMSKAGVVFGTRPFARRALPKGQLTRERAGAPRYRKSLDCVCGDDLGKHIGDGGCAGCDCTAFRKAQPVYVLRMRKSESVEVPEIPKCDFHPQAPAYADARLPSVGSWANVCKDCFHAHGASLGTGRGQVYMAQGRSKPQAKKSKTPCPRCEAGDHGREKREDGLRHRATMKTPSINTVMKWDFDGDGKATDGCKVEADGLCQHGHQSWIRRMGIM